MDHLPLPHNSPWNPIEVPLYTYNGQSYTNSSPWETYPERQGYGAGNELFFDDLNEENYPEHMRPQLAAFVQSWLYFGTLIDFLQEPLPVQDWLEIRAKASKPFNYRVCTRDLLPLLDSWCRSVLSDRENVRRAKIACIDRLLEQANGWLAHFSVSVLDLRHPRDLLPRELFMSIDVLFATLKIARNIAAVGQPPLEEHYSLQYELLPDRFRVDGWCPSEIKRVQSDCYSIISEYCISFLGPVQNELDHSKCTLDLCSASQIDHATYKTKHFVQSCQCGKAVNVGSSVAHVLRTGETPVIRLNSDGTAIEVIAASDINGFIAISHVWSGGLGNLEQSSLPFCQLRRIQKQINAVYFERFGEDAGPGNSYFWIDTICVPVGDVFTAERNIALAGMKEVYRGADATLILDNELQNIPSDRAAWELSARINRTAWFRRLWTLHEGVLSKCSLFLLQDYAIEMSELRARLRDDPQLPNIALTIHKMIFDQASSPFTAMQSFKSLPKFQRSQEIWTAVHSRSTSNQEDETICLSNMLELDLAPILSIDRNDPDVCDKRMQVFILQQKLFPQSSLFSGEIEGKLTLPQRGFRWAPRSFVFRHGGTQSEANPTLAPATSSGLHVNLPGIDPGGNWKDFLKRIRFDDLLTEETVDKTVAFTIPEIIFMIPFQWDVYYSLRWNFEAKWPLTKDILEETMPAIILKEDLVNIEIDSRQLSHDGRRVREFAFDVPSSCDLTEALPTSKSCPALVVAASKGFSPSSINQSAEEHQVSIIASASVSKNLFSRSNEAAWSQLFFSSKRIARMKLSCFSGLPATTSWCVG